MDKIKIFAQAYTIPKNGGVFWYDVLSTYKDISWNDIEFNITGASVAERDTTNDRFSLNFSSTTTTRTISGTIQFRFTDGEYYTYDFSTTQTGDSGYTYIQDNIQSEILGNDPPFPIVTIPIKSNETLENVTARFTQYDKTNHILGYDERAVQVILTEDYSGAYLFNSISEFRDACLAGTITNGKWVYVKGVAQNVNWVDSSSFAYLTFTDPNSDYKLNVTNVYNLGNVPYTSSNYTDAQYITTLGFSYNSSTTWGSNTYSVASSRLPFAYTQNGVTTTPGAREGRTPVEPIFSGYKAKIYLWWNDLGITAYDYVTILKSNSTPITTTIVKQAGQAGSISVEYPTMTVSGRIDTYYNKITHPNIAVSNISYSASGTGDITPSIVTIDGKQYVKLEVVTSNIGAESSRSKTVTVKGIDGTNVTRTTEFTITQTNDEPKINVTPLYASDRPLQIGWQGQDVTFQLSCTNIASIDEVSWGMGVPSEQQSLEYTLTEKSYGWDCVVTIPQNPTNDYNQSKIIFKGTTTYTPASSEYNYLDSPYVRQEATPPGTITVTTSNPYLHSYAQNAIYVDYTTEWMDDSTIIPTVTGDLINPNSLTWNTTNKYVKFNVTANSTDSERQSTITLTGTDHIGITRTTEYTVTQVPQSQDSFIRLVKVTSGTTYPYKNATITGSFVANNVDNIRLEPNSGTTFIESLTITPTSIAKLYNFEATLSQNTTDSPRTKYYQFVGDNTLQDSIWGETIIASGALHPITQKCEPGSITVSSNTLSVPATANTNNSITFTPYRLSNTSATLSGIEGTVSLSNSRIVLTTPFNESYEELTGVITLTGTDYNGDTVTQTINVTKRPNIDIIITPTSQTLNAGENTASYEYTLVNVSNLRLTFSGDSSFVSNYTIENGVLNINTTDLDVRASKTTLITVIGDVPNGTTYSTEITLTKNGLDGLITVTPDSFLVNKKASNIEFTYSLDGVSSVNITTSGSMSFGTVSTSGTTVTVPYALNDTDSELTGIVTLTGTDYKGKTITANVNVRQLNVTGTITVTPKSQIVEYGQGYATIDVITDNSTFTNVEFSGNTVYVNHYERNGNTITVYFNDITVATSFKVVATVSGITNDGDNVSDKATFILYGVDGYIEIPTDTIYRNKESGSYNFDFSCFGVNITDVTSDSDWLTIGSIQGDGMNPGVYNSYIRVAANYAAYTGVPSDWDTNRVGKIIVTGTDYKGKTVVYTGNVVQYAVDAEMTVSPTEETIEYNEYLDIDVNLVGAAPVPEIDVSALAIGETFSYEWLNEWDDYFVRNNTVRIHLPINNTYVDRQYTIIFKCEPPYLGATIWRYVYVTQKAKPASITLSPSSYLANKNSGYVTFNVTVDGVSQSSLLIANYPSWVTSASLNSDKTVLTVNYPNNPDVETRVGEICLTEPTRIIVGCATITQTGVDPEINVSNLVIRYNESSTNHFIGTKGVGDLSVSFDGEVIISNYTITPTTGGYTLLIETPDNLTYNNLRSTATVTGTVNAGQYEGQTLTKTFEVVKSAKDGVIIITPLTQYIKKAGGTATFEVTYGNMNMSTVTTNIGSFNSDKTILTVNVSANSNSTSRTFDITLSGVDNNGGSRSATAYIVQYGTDPSIEVGNIGIPNTQRVTTVSIGTNWVENLSVSFSGDVIIEDYSLTQTDNGYELTITTPDNLENNPLYSTAVFTGSVTTEPGQTVTKQVQVIKYGKEGVITVNPTSFVLKKIGGTITVDLLYANMDMSTITASDGTFNSDKSQLTCTIGANPNLTDRNLTITISGTDINGITRTATVTILQYGTDPYISITPSSRTLLNDESQATFSVTAYKTNNLTVAFNGALDIINYSLENGTLTVETGPNEELLSIIELITITGTSDNGETITATATITKFGTGGGLVIDPEFTIAGGADGENGMLIVPYLTDRIKENTVYAFINGDIDVKSILVIRDGKFVAIEYTHNTSSESKVSTLTLTSYDEDDVPRIVTSTITQLPSQYTFTIKPPIRWLEHTSGSTTGTVKSENMTAVTSFNHFGDMDASYDNSLNGTINVTYQANSEVYAKWIALSITGVSSSGDTVVTSAWYIQRSSNSDDYEFKFLDTSQYDITVDGGGRKIYYDIISTLGSDVIPYSITGFILKGYWTNLPSVRYNNGDPYLVIPINIREAVRSVELSFLQEQSYRTLYAIVHQEEGAEPDVHPIWETSELTSPNGTFIEYHITNDGDIIYAGKAYRFPEESETVWSVNDITSNYLGNGIYFTEGIQQIPNYAKDFFIGTSANAKYVKTFYNSWAYKHTDYWLSDPIDHRVDPRQWLPVSFLSTNQHLITIGGRVYAALKENDGWTVMTNLKNYTLDCDAGITAVGTGSINYTVSNGDYVLYYSNAYGGWDSLLVTGTTKKTDDIEHLTYKKRSRNMSQFSKVNYQNNITPTWSLNTGITIDGSKMYHLLESTMVYLHNLETNEIIPVVITNSQCEYLTYRNNGRRPYYYNITVEESNNKLRK